MTILPVIRTVGMKTSSSSLHLSLLRRHYAVSQMFFIQAFLSSQIFSRLLRSFSWSPDRWMLEYLEMSFRIRLSHVVLVFQLMFSISLERLSVIFWQEFQKVNKVDDQTFTAVALQLSVHCVLNLDCYIFEWNQCFI